MVFSLFIIFILLYRTFLILYSLLYLFLKKIDSKMIYSMKYDRLQKHIAFRIRECRKEQKLSQEKLSELAGLGIKAIQNMENMKYDFKIKTLESVIKALGITVEEFFNLEAYYTERKDFLKLQAYDSESEDSLEILFDNLTKLPKEKQGKIISSFNEIVKNIK